MENPKSNQVKGNFVNPLAIKYLPLFITYLETNRDCWLS
ncbi:hypothetical protein LYNGBM3L_36940 [Moorena producens 3L]|uniref:Uncharacterized protein n=1 Tax=Moorena producens 3L TaxID=489825 RepID=F4XQ08_9CYAN|nr:hypothetical protein LYNGBM3L_36940 [Moorena producens 3L]